VLRVVKEEECVMKACGKAPCLHNLGIRCRGVPSGTLRPFCFCFPEGWDADVQGVANRMLTAFCGGFKLDMQSLRSR